MGVLESVKNSCITISDLVRTGGAAFLQFAITNQTNATCECCGFFPTNERERERKVVTLEEVTQVLDICLKHRFRYVLYLFEEPLMTPHFRCIVEETTGRGLVPMVCIDGALLSDEYARQLCDVGIKGVFISLDPDSAMVPGKSKAFLQVCANIRRASKTFQAQGVDVALSLSINALIQNIQGLLHLMRDLGQSTMTFSHPLTTGSSNHLGYSQSNLDAFSQENLSEMLSAAKILKRDISSMSPLASFTCKRVTAPDKREVYECLGGHKYFYLDWNLMLYRCSFWEKPLCKIVEFNGSQSIKFKSQGCGMGSSVDSSVYRYIGIGLREALEAFKAGNIIRSAGLFFDYRNWLLLRSSLRHSALTTKVNRSLVGIWMAFIDMSNPILESPHFI